MVESSDSGNGQIFHCKHCDKQFSSEQALEMHVNAKHFAAQPRQAGDSFTKKHKWKIIAIALVFLLSAGVWAVYSSAVNAPKIGPVGSTHIHADIKVYVDGLPIDFSQQKYQLRKDYVHFEGGNGGLVHMHATGVTMGLIFESLAMRFSGDCLRLDDGRNLCNSNATGKTLKFIVNNQSNSEFDKYVFRDLDKLLVSYGAETEEQVERQIATITDEAKQERSNLIDNPLAAHGG